MSFVRWICLTILFIGFNDSLTAQRSDSTLKQIDYSDLAWISDNHFLAVTDRKNPIEPGYRVMRLTLTAKEGLVADPISVKDWRDAEGAPSDLEACCRIPGRKNEFLLAESSCYKGKYGRVFHVRLQDAEGDSPKLEVQGVMRIYDRKLNENQCSYSGDNVAGIVCFEGLGKLVLAYGERGGECADGKKRGTLVWGELELDGHRFDKWGESPLATRPLPGSRDCAALHLVKNPDGGLDLLSVATDDPGENGPFYSVIFRAGTFRSEAVDGQVGFLLESEPVILARVDGHKVEGLASAVSNAARADFCISTDDENLGGVWRAIVLESSYPDPRYSAK